MLRHWIRQFIFMLISNQPYPNSSSNCSINRHLRWCTTLSYKVLVPTKFWCGQLLSEAREVKEIYLLTSAKVSFALRMHLNAVKSFLGTGLFILWPVLFEARLINFLRRHKRLGNYSTEG